MSQIIWLKWIYPDNDTENAGKVEWKLRDISLYSLVTLERNSFYQQWLEYKWETNISKGIERIDLDAYPRLVSKEHLILLCNIERPYMPKYGDIIEGPRDEKRIIKIIWNDEIENTEKKLKAIEFT